MRRLKRVWRQIKDSWRKSITAVGIILLIAVLTFLVGDYAGVGIFSWAGVRGKTLWDWLQLLIIPAVLAGGAMWFSRAEREAEREIADDRLREAALQGYLDRMTELLLKEGLRTSEADDESRAVARARTLTALRQLDGERKATLLRFLYEADLINRDDAVIVLERADLIKAKLWNANLSGANLSKVMLWGADLSEADLGEADLKEAILVGTNLSEADLGEVDLSGAIMDRANLHMVDLNQADLGEAVLIGADLSKADLSGADLYGAYLCGADLSMADLSGADLRRTDRSEITYDDNTKWPLDFTPPPNAIKKE